LASRSHGVVTRTELLAAGISEREVDRRLQRGVLIRVHRGVYRVGHRAPSVEARYLAAVLACGAGAVLSGRAAGHLLGLLKGGAPPPEVTAPGERRVPGVRTRRARRGERPRATTVRGIPVTTVAQTLVDLARELDEDALARACHEAGGRHRTTPAQVEAILARRPKSPGAGRLRAVIRGEVRVTLSKLESSFLRLLERHRLPLPQTNRPAGSRRVDARWPDHKLTVELDSYRYHHSRHAWEQDRQREREAHARGDRHRRYTHSDVHEQPQHMLAELRQLLVGPSADAVTAASARGTPARTALAHVSATPPR
jgi:very-short-patch-repair endonuclease